MEFKIVEDGKEIKCKSILVFKDDGNDINYVVYKEDNDENIYASRYDIVNDEVILKAIENDYEWDMIDNILERSGN